MNGPAPSRRRRGRPAASAVGRSAAALALLLSLAVLGAGVARADQGVRISLGNIDVNDPVRAGGTYHLPDLTVSDPGSDAGDYTMVAGPVEGQSALPLDPTWVAFTPATFSLAAGASQRVSVALAIPSDAKPGAYAGLLRAQVAPAGGGGVGVGAAAASRLTFTVAAGGGLDSLIASVREAIGAAWPWPLVIVLVLAALLVASFVVRRWNIRIERRG